MTYLDPQESKLALGALILATIAGIALPAYIIAENKVTKRGKDTIAVAPDAKLLGGVLLVLCIIGFLALWKRRRTLVVFDLFLIGFAFTLFIGLVGFVFILLGGWFMLRAWRISRYGTTNSKLIAKEAAARPRGRQRRETAKTSTKTSAPAGRKPPTRQQALHAQGPSEEEDSEAERVRSRASSEAERVRSRAEQGCMSPPEQVHPAPAIGRAAGPSSARRLDRFERVDGVDRARPSAPNAGAAAHPPDGAPANAPLAPRRAPGAPRPR